MLFARCYCWSVVMLYAAGSVVDAVIFATRESSGGELLSVMCTYAAGGELLSVVSLLSHCCWWVVMCTYAAGSAVCCGCGFTAVVSTWLLVLLLFHTWMYFIAIIGSQ